jgi:hypothetical protein
MVCCKLKKIKKKEKKKKKDINSKMESWDFNGRFFPLARIRSSHE